MKAIKVFCQKILPAVFDDSLSYYEAVCKLTAKLNEVIKLVNDVIDQKLVEYIEQRFDNLMLNAVYNEEEETIYLLKGVKDNG